MATPPVDLVTSLQEAIGRLNAVLFNYIGALQRDAPPRPLKEEPVVAAPKSYDLQAHTELMSNDLTAGLQEIERLIQQLPEVAGGGPGGEASEVAQAVALLQQNAEASAQLQAELQAATAKLAQLQDAHGAMAEAVLSHRAATAPAAAAAGTAATAGRGGSSS